MTLVDGVMIGAATFAVAYIIAQTDGPWGLFAKCRERLPLGGLLGCWVCLSCYIGPLLVASYYLVTPWLVRGLFPVAISVIVGLYLNVGVVYGD